jgi:hypothetical protein
VGKLRCCTLCDHRKETIRVSREKNLHFLICVNYFDNFIMCFIPKRNFKFTKIAYFFRLFDPFALLMLGRAFS